jgi:type IV secretory pathway VirD2 relaxase
MRSVAKHSYIKGESGKARAKAHVSYIQHRSGDDREKGGRTFFNKDRDDVKGKDVKREIEEQTERGVTVHKIILSPGINGVDLKEYTREVMDELGRSKGLDLKWDAVEHTNTDHDHVHVVVMGKDEHGRRVRLDRDDHKTLRETGDRYLEREHTLDRYLDRDMFFMLKREERSKEPEYTRQKGDKLFNRLIYGDEKERKRGDDRDRREFEDIEKKEPVRGLEAPKGRQQRMYEQRGRLSEAHDTYVNSQARQYWKDIADRRPDLAQAAERELSSLTKFEQQSSLEQRSRNDGIDRLLGQSTERERGHEDRSDRTEKPTRERGDDDEARGRGSRGDR